MVRCVINLEKNGRAVYFAGEMLKGTIELHLDQPKKLRGLCFSVFGAAKCHWSVREKKHRGFFSSNRDRNIYHTVHYEGINIYLNAKTFLFGGPGATSIDMPSGTHRFDFACQLPPLIPESFEGKHGSIRYHVEAELDIPWAFDKEFKLGFTVVRKDDLNFEPQLKLPSQAEIFKQFCCLFCKSNPLAMVVTLPYTGFIPGQNARVTVNYNNKSDVNVSKTRITLDRIISYHSSTPYSNTKYQHVKMAEVDCQGVKNESSVTIEQDLMIPGNILSSNNNYCNVVKISYVIKVVALLSGCNGKCEIAVPITIGSVPLIFDQTPQYMNNATMPYAPVPYTDNFVVATAPELPPSFDDAIAKNMHIGQMF